MNNKANYIHNSSFSVSQWNPKNSISFKQVKNEGMTENTHAMADIPINFHKKGIFLKKKMLKNLNCTPFQWGLWCSLKYLQLFLQKNGNLPVTKSWKMDFYCRIIFSKSECFCRWKFYLFSKFCTANTFKNFVYVLFRHSMFELKSFCVSLSERTYYPMKFVKAAINDILFGELCSKWGHKQWCLLECISLGILRTKNDYVRKILFEFSVCQ